MPDIKSILDGIIDGANNNFPNTMNTTLQQNMGVKTPQTFDSGKFREKLSLYVLKDVISAMMADDTKDIDGMIDQSIMRHIRDKYGCGCYDYLCKASKVLPSPTLSGIIQEIDKKTMEVKTKVGDTKNADIIDDEANMKEELKNCESWEELREMLRETVSKKVVEDVADVISNSNRAATFGDVDNYLEKRPVKAPDEDVTKESVIMRMCGRIVSEGAIHGVQLSVEDGLERAITEYCIAHMDYLFKMDPIMSGLMLWDTNRPIQESFFDMYKDGSLVVQEATKYTKDVLKGSLLGALVGAAGMTALVSMAGAAGAGLTLIDLICFGGIFGGSVGASTGMVIADASYKDKKLFTNTMESIDDICKILKEQGDESETNIKRLKKAIKELKMNMTIMKTSLAFQDYFKIINRVDASCERALKNIKSGNHEENASVLKELLANAIKLREELTGESTEELIKTAKSKKAKK